MTMSISDSELSSMIKFTLSSDFCIVSFLGLSSSYLGGGGTIATGALETVSLGAEYVLSIYLEFSIGSANIAVIRAIASTDKNNRFFNSHLPLSVQK